jgi:HlyD family secretion protein
LFIKSENKVKIRPVKTGIQDEKYIEITNGLSVGEVVITGPYSAVSKFLKHNDVIKEVMKSNKEIHNMDTHLIKDITDLKKILFHFFD